MQKVIVFGAAGRTGKYVVQYALDAGYAVTAFVHRNTVPVQHYNLTIVEGDVLDAEKISALIKGHDVVISTLGAPSIEGDAVNLMSNAMKVFIAGMQQHGVKRMLAVGGLGVLQMNETTQLLYKPDYPQQYFNIGEGHNKVYKVLQASNTNWTFICCPDIIDGPRTGKYQVKKDYPADGLYQIYTGDIADFMLKEIAENKFVQTRVGIANTEK